MMPGLVSLKSRLSSAFEGSAPYRLKEPSHATNEYDMGMVRPPPGRPCALGPYGSRLYYPVHLAF
jgi:hypothetical protein